MKKIKNEDIKSRSEEGAKILIDEHLRQESWNLTNFSEIKKEHLTPTQEDLWIT